MAEQDLRDYGTPEERAEREAAARGQLADARRHAAEQAGTPGRRPTR
ncbi:hypothetical protein ACFSJS_22660 [Streptomyces desertarenae]|uniref:Uncharacterized protein n=1 Tax=Streptomyces desertarenae TaxID=2666184 RepID=A0ABW4PSQ5_9ACTN